MSDKSQNSQFPTIERVFELLDRWRHLPNYQLERRADIFFALFLPEVLEAHLSKQENCSVEINPTLIPEFPIKKKNGNQSINVDYFALSQDGERAFLIELKTDMKSIDKKREPNRISVLKNAAMAQIIDGLKSIAKSESVRRDPQTRGKYFRLFYELENMKLIKIPNRDDFEELLPRRQMKKPKYEQYIEEIYEVGIGKSPSLKIVYVVPESDPILCDVDRIYFEEFACIVERGQGSKEVRSLIACYLRKWVQDARARDTRCSRS